MCVCTGIFAFAWTEKLEDPKLRTIFGSIADVKSPAFAVMVRKHGNVVFERTYGVRELRTMQPVDAGTNFRLASFTKQFTAMATMLLPDYEDLMDQFEKTHGATWSATHQIKDNEVLRLLEHETHGKFAPGLSWAYSNSAYVVLGLIDAQATGELFLRVLQDRIFGPLHMTRTLAFIKGLNEVPDRAY